MNATPQTKAALSEGAMRAAASIRTHFVQTRNPAATDERIAEIIERHTGAAEMLAALREVDADLHQRHFDPALPARLIINHAIAAAEGRA